MMGKVMSSRTSSVHICARECLIGTDEGCTAWPAWQALHCGVRRTGLLLTYTETLRVYTTLASRETMFKVNPRDINYDLWNQSSRT